MRRRLVAIVVMLALGAVPGTAGGQVANPVDQIFASDNVTVVNRLAEGAGAISMRFDRASRSCTCRHSKDSRSTTSTTRVTRSY